MNLKRLVQKSFGNVGAQSSESRMPKVPVYDVTDFADQIDLGYLDVIRWAPCWMTRAERLLIFTLIFGLRPERYLEIGTFQGGSALIVNAALQASQNPAPMVCVDPDPQIAPEHRQRLAPRMILLKGYSPNVLPEACDRAGGKFDFVLIDGDHSYHGVLRDAEGVLDVLAPRAYLLFHDAFHVDIAQALDEFVRRHRNEVLDFGPLTREVTFQKRGAEEVPVYWGGLRIIRKIH